MLTADLVHTRRRGDRLMLVPIADQDRPRARELASMALGLVRSHVGLPRGALMQAFGEVAMAPAEVRLGRALFKLALDACEFDEGTGMDAVELRREVFLRAAACRTTGGRDFDRAALLRQIASERAVDADAIEEALYADLPTAHILRKADLPTPDGLLAEHELASHQAVLLRSVHVRARVWSAGAGGYRALFRKLKFHRLLYTMSKLDRDSGYELAIDGPMSLFEQTTKYGLKLALALPAIMACDTWDLVASLRWGKDRRALRYHLRGGGVQSGRPAQASEDALPDDVATLLADLRGLETPWQARPSDAVLDVPGIGVCVPDLELERDGKRVFVEVLGFWSREAVWKRIDMAEHGLPHPILFAVSKHLRVSEEALAEGPAALYVYARAMSARAVLERAAELAEKMPQLPQT